jgi:hypothetical protein
MKQPRFIKSLKYQRKHFSETFIEPLQRPGMLRKLFNEAYCKIQYINLFEKNVTYEALENVVREMFSKIEAKNVRSINLYNGILYMHEAEYIQRDDIFDSNADIIGSNIIFFGLGYTFDRFTIQEDIT